MQLYPEKFLATIHLYLPMRMKESNATSRSVPQAYTWQIPLAWHHSPMLMKKIGCLREDIVDDNRMGKHARFFDPKQ